MSGDYSNLHPLCTINPLMLGDYSNLHPLYTINLLLHNNAFEISCIMENGAFALLDR